MPGARARLSSLTHHKKINARPQKDENTKKNQACMMLQAGIRHASNGCSPLELAGEDEGQSTNERIILLL